MIPLACADENSKSAKRLTERGLHHRLVSMDNVEPALNRDHIERLERLTRDYARYSSGCGGLGTVLGGCFVLLFLLVDLLGHRGSMPVWGAFAPLNLQALLPLTALPILWLGARQGMRIWWYEKHGRVEPVPISGLHSKGKHRAVIMGFAILVWLFCSMGLLQMGHAPQKPLRAALILGLLATFSVALLWLRLTRIERILGAFLFVVPAFLLAGVRLPAADLVISLPVMGLTAIGFGFREHFAFRRISGELSALQGL